MKKFICMLAFASVLAVSFTACSDEEIKPKTELDGAGGTGSDPIRR